MQKPDKGPVSGPSYVGSVLNTRSFLVHNAHVQNGNWFSTRCAFCRNGVSQVVRADEKVAPADDVDKNSGADQEESAAYTFDYGQHRE